MSSACCSTVVFMFGGNGLRLRQKLLLGLRGRLFNELLSASECLVVDEEHVAGHKTKPEVLRNVLPVLLGGHALEFLEELGHFDAQFVDGYLLAFDRQWRSRLKKVVVSICFKSSLSSWHDTRHCSRSWMSTLVCEMRDSRTLHLFDRIRISKKAPLSSKCGATCNYHRPFLSPSCYHPS
ncbi:hypothetical protein HDK64DRAFT_55407 [Phyllosticta capitalensis]